MILRPQLRLRTVTRRDRHEVTAELRHGISEGGAWITGARPFSNAAIVFDIDVGPDRLADLYEAIEAVGLRLSRRWTRSTCRRLRSGTLRVEFVHDDPDLRLPVPAVPG